MTDLMRPVSPSPAGPTAATTLALTAVAACFATSVGVATALLGGLARVEPAPPPPALRCALPAGVALSVLAEADRTLVVRRLLACADLDAGRITADEYRAELRALAPAPAPITDTAITIIAPLPEVMWASRVLSRSSQYGEDSWSAAQVLGAPDVFPGHGDNVNAWASEGEDDRAEHLEVGFDQPRRIRGVDIFETYNPGAVSKVELILASGRRQIAYAGKASAIAEPAHRRSIAVACTDEPVVAVRVTLDSVAVEGWNELDAIGVVPCAAAEAERGR